MRKTTIDKLCDALNQAHRLTYPMRGYVYFADIRGDGSGKRRVYIVSNDFGGLTACYNGATYRQTAAKLRESLACAHIF
jgi:hypothetical protein